jgi:hypothetical protein
MHYPDPATRTVLAKEHAERLRETMHVGRSRRRAPGGASRDQPAADQPAQASHLRHWLTTARRTAL